MRFQNYNLLMSGFCTLPPEQYFRCKTLISHLTVILFPFATISPNDDHKDICLDILLYNLYRTFKEQNLSSKIYQTILLVIFSGLYYDI